MSLRFRLALAGALAILIALGLSAFGLAQLFGAHVERRALAEMRVQLDLVLAGLEQGPQGLTLARPLADPRFAVAYGGLYWQIEGPEGVTRSRSLWDAVLELPKDRLGDGGTHVHHLQGPNDTALLVLERSVTLPARLGGNSARVSVAMDLAEIEAARRDFVVDLAPVMALLALALTVAGWAQLSVGLRPLQRLGLRVAALRAGSKNRMGGDWPVEVQPVAAEIDALLSAREAETERARARAADLAHGLKTPLQALMGEAARLRASGAEDQAAGIEDTARAMRRTVDRELSRARTAARAGDARADAAQVADRLITVLRRTPDGARLDWRQTIPNGYPVALDEADLAEALGALAENAARHARSTVTLTAEIDAARVKLRMADDGHGIPEEQREILMRRHARADEHGTGLGLTIASEIAQTAGGSLSLVDTNPGLMVTLMLPRAKQREG